MPLDFYKSKKYKSPDTYAVKHCDLSVRMESRSGGIFTALSDVVLEQGGVIYGCVLTDSFNAVHIRAETPEQRDAMRGSKYIQSEMTDMFKQVKKDLEGGRQVLFSGTSCQVSGLSAFLGKDYDNLLLVDIVCHGVPSPKVWQKYLSWQEKLADSKVIGVDFRNKHYFGWAAHHESLFMLNGKQVNSEVFKNLFYGHYILRPSCYKCPYKDVIHPGNITIADYWGIQKIAPSFDDNKGVSLVMINDNKGREWFQKVNKYLEIIETRIEDSLQPPLQRPFERPKNRTQFWNMMETKSFEAVAKKYGGYGEWNWIKRHIKASIRKLLRKAK